MTVTCGYCYTEHEYEDPKDLDVLVYWDGEAAVVYCDASCWMAETLHRLDSVDAA